MMFHSKKQVSVSGVKLLLLTLFLFFGTSALRAQEKNNSIQWMDIQEAIEANKKTPKKIFFDVYTDWCGWCKKMDATTFQHPEIIRYMNENYYAVKFNAESSEKIKINGKEYGSSNPEKTKSPHEFAVEMLQGRLSYPSFAVYNSNIQNIGIVPGFQTAKDIEPILNYFATESYRSISWEQYKQSFNGQIK